ncbi:hypothetical protein HBH64_158370 [Parastagonospora nodorum]|nr:hypothetical protein HBH46_022670 [Parastagonospora nodorum]KAH4311664.1 hypothetical protein HBI01_020220 [Parastagonospora nodorum]KAH4316759.1 hypothetical protein HBI02_036560 [Parastagonospora nodorum]KAH4326700.1 hypothetical protein HBI00_140460 [Parastagonospora nodorum]KAH4388553.1 hypothetical protein HBH94_036420 [Parastagonospora nodorum]
MSTTNARGYSSFYFHIAYNPELGNFRRFAAYWAKRVHDETAELSACIANLDREIKRFPNLDAQTVLDCPKRTFQEGCPDTQDQYKNVNSLWKEYDEALMRYGEVLCMSERIMNFPTQDKFNTKKLRYWTSPHYKPLSDQDEFVPTGEPAKTYKDDPETTDTCAWRAFAHDDFLTNRFLELIPWIDEQILDRWRRLRVRGVKHGEAQLPSTLHYKKIVRTLDTLTCALASGVLVITIGVLKVVRPWSIRIILTCIFGTLFAILLKIMAGSLTRGEVFTATAAFYAVAVVFVSNTDNNYAGH